jgi:pSer/pThr/pTyr-binding forkhead associated (FHA) protein
MELILHIDHPQSGTNRLRLKQSALIGRAADCQIRLALPEISRKHCQLTFQDGQVLLRDLGSSNGTRLNGKPIRPGVDHVVEQGGVIELGPLSCRVEIRGPGDDDSTTLTSGHEDTRQGGWPSPVFRIDEKTAVKRTDQDPTSEEEAADASQSSLELPAIDVLLEDFGAPPPSSADAAPAGGDDLALQDFLKKMSP